jgi:hypothetical protein
VLLLVGVLNATIYTVRVEQNVVLKEEEEEEEEPNGCYLVFYYTYDRLNMFGVPLYPSSGAHDYISDYHLERLILRLLMFRV